MARVNAKQILRTIAKSAILHYKDCGICERTKIRANIAKRMLGKIKLSMQDVKDLREEADKIWSKTKYGTLHQELIGKGYSPSEIEKAFEQRGWQL